MGGHLQHAGRGDVHQRAVLERIVRDQPSLMRVLEGLQRLGLPDAMLCSGAIYNCVWNVLTGREPMRGIKDFDIAYFDASDLSYEAEDAVIHRAAAEFADVALPVEVRNQARVHLWFPQKFGVPYPQLTSSAGMLENFASRTHAVAVRLDHAGALEIIAPFGLDDIFAFRLTPNYRLDNRATHESKGRRALALWPELEFVPWRRGG